MKAIEVGQTLHNGATVIRFNEKVILAKWTNDITPYVTWRYTNNDPDTTAIGHYFKNFEDAEKDFLTR
jgi:phosphotransferase system IIA component